MRIFITTIPDYFMFLLKMVINLSHVRIFSITITCVLIYFLSFFLFISDNHVEYSVIYYSFD